MGYKVHSKMKKWEIRDYGDGIFEIVIAVMIWTAKFHYIDALVELSKDYYILSIRQMGVMQPHFIVTTMPKEAK